VVHPKESAACATRAGTFWVPGPYHAKNRSSPRAPAITSTPVSVPRQLIGLVPEACLGVGVCTSGHYVRTGESPSLGDARNLPRQLALTRLSFLPCL
jgi:hypothetical protein